MELTANLQIFHFVAIAIAFIAMVTDSIHGRIYNWLTFPTILLGWVLSFYTGGAEALGYSIIGTLVGILLYLPAAAFGLMGMGDVKLLGALGALGGSSFVVSIFLYSSALGIPHALFIQWLNYRGSAFSMLLTSFSTKIFLEKTIQKENATAAKEGKFRFLLGIDIFVATVIASFFTIAIKY